MSTAGDLLQTIAKLSALEARTSDVVAAIVRVEEKINSLIDRIARLEEGHKHIRESVKSQILGDIKAEFATLQIQIEHQQASAIVNRRGRRRSSEE